MLYISALQIIIKQRKPSSVPPSAAAAKPKKESGSETPKGAITESTLAQLCDKESGSRRIWICTECMQIFREKRYLKQHTQVVHNQVRRYACVHCDRAFGTSASRYRHESICSKNEYRDPTVTVTGEPRRRRPKETPMTSTYDSVGGTNDSELLSSFDNIDT